MTRYYERFPPAPAEFVSDFSAVTGIRLHDAKVCRYNDVIMEVIAEGVPDMADTALRLDVLVSIAEYFQVNSSKLSVGPGPEPGTMVVEVMDQEVWGFEVDFDAWQEAQLVADEDKELACEQGFDAGYAQGYEDGFDDGDTLDRAAEEHDFLSSWEDLNGLDVLEPIPTAGECLGSDPFRPESRDVDDDEAFLRYISDDEAEQL